MKPKSAHAECPAHVLQSLTAHNLHSCIADRANLASAKKGLADCDLGGAWLLPRPAVVAVSSD